jgi:hypothetical protein
MFITLSVFSQKKLAKEASVNLPSSIYVSISYDNFSFYKQPLTEELNLTGFKFMIVNYLNNGFSFNNSDFVNVDLRNIGRSISLEDLSDNIKKAQLYLNDVNFNRNHLIWRMWDTTLQTQH